MKPDRQTQSAGRLILVTAPSGAGKTTLVKALLEKEPKLRFSISYTTRRPRAHETDGTDYFFVSRAEFDAMIGRDEFLEYAQVFDNWYGTSRRHVEELIDAGYLVLLEIDWQGARQVRKAMPAAVTVFILPPSVDELERRLRGRASDSEEAIARRLRDALGDMSHWQEFDFVIINDDVDIAAAQLREIVTGRAANASTKDAAVRKAVGAIIDSGRRSLA